MSSAADASGVIGVLLADDQELVRAGLRMIIDTEPDLAVLGEARDGVEAAAGALPRNPGGHAHDVRPLATRLRLPGGRCLFLLKDSPGEQLVNGIRAAHRGEELLAPAITRRVIEEFTRPGRLATAPGMETLTERELEVLRLVARGCSNAEIAADLVISIQTVKTHVARMLAKLGVRDRVQAVVIAYESGLVWPGTPG